MHILCNYFTDAAVFHDLELSIRLVRCFFHHFSRLSATGSQRENIPLDNTPFSTCRHSLVPVNPGSPGSSLRSGRSKYALNLRFCHNRLHGQRNFSLFHFSRRSSGSRRCALRLFKCLAQFPDYTDRCLDRNIIALSSKNP